MKRSTIDLWVGCFFVIGIASLLFLSMKVGNLASSHLQNPYEIKANFGNIGGLKVRGAVRSAGVVVGRISNITLDHETYQAVATLNIDERYKFPTDTFASINTSGLLGEQYVSLEPGGDEALLKAGDTIKKTQSAVVLEKLIGQFLYNKPNDSSAAAK